MNTKIILGILAAIVVVAGVIFINQKNSGDGKMMDDKMMKKDDKMSKVGKFVNWEEVNLADLDGKIVLDFSAT
jgi:glucose uptake protein GlcU